MPELAVHPCEAAPRERCAAPRYEARDLRSITGVRLSPGNIEGTLVNLSSTGVLVELAPASRLLSG